MNHVVLAHTFGLFKKDTTAPTGDTQNIENAGFKTVAGQPPFDFCLSITTRFDNKHTRGCLASRRSVSGWGLVTHGAMVL